MANLKPEHMDARPDGSYIFDMGQNMVGWVTLKVKGPSGTKVRLRFAERLNPDSTIYTANLRNADATDTYILKGAGEETFAPHFTFHGFRFQVLRRTRNRITALRVAPLARKPTAKAS